MNFHLHSTKETNCLSKFIALAFTGIGMLYVQTSVSTIKKEHFIQQQNIIREKAEAGEEDETNYYLVNKQ